MTAATLADALEGPALTPRVHRDAGGPPASDARAPAAEGALAATTAEAPTPRETVQPRDTGQVPAHLRADDRSPAPPTLVPARPVEPQAEPGPPPAPARGLALVDRLLRAPGTVLDRIERGEALPDLARTTAISIAVCAAMLGATLGVYRGGLQILYAAIKLPLVLLLTAGLTAPVLTALDVAVGGRGDLRRDVAAVLVALASTALLMAAAAPVIMLAGQLGVGYHGLILLTVGCCAVAGLAGLTLFARALARRGRGRLLVGMAFLTVCGVVGCQLAWTLRPWVVRPRTVEVPFVRPIEGGFLDAVGGAYDSARGIYRRPAAPLPEGGRSVSPDVRP